MNYLECVCDKVGSSVGTASVCGIPKVIDAIKRGAWVEVASLIILGGASTLAPHTIVASVIVAHIACAMELTRDVLDSTDGNSQLADAIAKEIEKLDFKELGRLMDMKPGQA